MGNAEIAYKIQSKLDEFFNEINDLVNTMVKGVSLKGYDMVKGVPLNKPSNPFPFTIVDDYLLRTAPGVFFGNELSKLEKDCKKIERMIPTSKDLNTDFSQSLKKIQKVTSKYINEYNNDYKGFLEKIIEEEKKNSTGIIIDTKHFLETNQYKKLYDICTSLTETLVSYNNKLTGFDCKLHPDTVKKIYYLMAEKFIKGDLQDFQTIFSNSSNTVIKPIQWLILNERGNNSGKGNQTALNVFLDLMLGKLSNSDRRKAKDLFIDEKGYFIKKSLLKPDKDKIGGYGFETGIEEILKKADH